VLAVLSHWTVVHRIYHTYRELRETDRAQVEAAQIQLKKAQANEKVMRTDYSVQS
jgi:hypothetical protein